MSDKKVFKGTQGEWNRHTLGWLSNSLKEETLPIMSNSVAVAGVYSNTLFDGTRGLPREEAEANAKLISAAPDLLKALQEVLRDYEDLYDNTDFEGSMLTRSNIDQAKEAIDKAL